jgi:RNA polymerase sigma-70 factor (ECF subfamily)
MTTAVGVPLRRSTVENDPHIAERTPMAPADARVDDGGLSAFLGVRARLFGVAYRVLGSAAEAEDVVQDVWVRWQTTDRSVVRDVAAFLVTTTTRLAINVIQSARSRRETYVGPRLPEPVDTSADPGLGAERGEAVELAVQMLLEKLSPVERAAYVLREAFDYPYRRIADILRVEEANTRQLVTRARRRVADGRRAPVRPAEQRRLLHAFVGAARSGDVAALTSLFASDIASSSDAGGFVRAAWLPATPSARVSHHHALPCPRAYERRTDRPPTAGHDDVALRARPFRRHAHEHAHDERRHDDLLQGLGHGPRRHALARMAAEC